MTYSFECTSCGNTFELDVDPIVMNEYLLRAIGKWEKCSSSGKQKCWRPIDVVLKDLDDRTKMMLKYAMCENCLMKIHE